jgi:1-acyl-sn-glycerol-3-phosphate acyltransferase
MRPTTTVSWTAMSPRNRVLTWLRFPYECFVLYGGLLLFAAFFFAWSAVATLLYPVLPRGFGTRLGQYAVMLTFRSYLAVLKASGLFKFDLGALDALRDQGALIIAPNHPSLLDAVLVGSRLPRIICIMKAEIQDNPILGGGARLAAYIRDNSPFNMIRSAVACLRAGNQLLMFPEGTRTRQKNRYRFKGGYALIAKTAGVPVQTVFIETNSKFLGKGWPLYRKPAFPLRYRVRLGQRFEVDGEVKSAVTAMERYHREAMASPIRAESSPQRERSAA